MKFILLTGVEWKKLRRSRILLIMGMAAVMLWKVAVRNWKKRKRNTARKDSSSRMEIPAWNRRLWSRMTLASVGRLAGFMTHPPLPGGPPPVW